MQQGQGATAASTQGKLRSGAARAAEQRFPSGTNSFGLQKELFLLLPPEHKGQAGTKNAPGQKLTQGTGPGGEVAARSSTDRPKPRLSSPLLRPFRQSFVSSLYSGQRLQVWNSNKGQFSFLAHPLCFPGPAALLHPSRVHWAHQGAPAAATVLAHPGHAPPPWSTKVKASAPV